MAKDKINLYTNRAEHFASLSGSLKNKVNLLSAIRIALFVTFLVLIVLAANERNFLLLATFVLLFPLVFGLLINQHNKLKYKKEHFSILSQINRDEIRRLKGELNQFNPGNEFMDKDHPYHNDLDIFGDNSLFQLVNHTTTPTGKKCLASLLSSFNDAELIKKRQESVKELREKIEWIQNLEATGLHFKNEEQKNLDDFYAWLQSSNLIRGHMLANFARFIGSFTGLAVILLYAFSVVPFIIVLGIMGINGLIIAAYLKKIQHIHNSTSKSIRSLQSFEALIRLVENEKFGSDHLIRLRTSFINEEIKASRIIGQLKKILQNLDNRLNMIYQLINLLFLLDLHFCISAERWKSRQPDDVRKWFDNLGEIETLNSLAAFAHANPGYTFPEFTNEKYHFSAKALGHPLISEFKSGRMESDLRVCNDFQIIGKSHVALITGSNMAGKSTFLRTVGINAVLGFAGGPVCASEMILSIFQIFTSMRTQDNLEEHISSFYAELKRIRQLLDTIEESTIPVLFLLDEILKGTNSRDRHTGALSLIYQLDDKDAFGLVSTHDLDLAKKTIKGANVTHYRFESSIREDRILFDYKLQEGICKTMNASKLMEIMGIQLIK